MRKVNVVIGDFRRRTFAEGLLARLSEYPELTVRIAQTNDFPALLNQISGPKVLVVDAVDFNMDNLPEGDALTIIAIGDEGRTACIRLEQINASQIAEMVSIAVKRALFQCTKSFNARALMLTLVPFTLSWRSDESVGNMLDFLTYRLALT